MKKDLNSIALNRDRTVKFLSYILLVIVGLTAVLAIHQKEYFWALSFSAAFISKVIYLINLSHKEGGRHAA